MAPLTDDSPPTYPSSMQPVPFPAGLAAEAAAQCRAVARMVGEKMQVASDAAADAEVGWTGGHHDDFELIWPDTETTATELVERLNRLAGEIEAAAAGAVSENNRREDQRAEYDRERNRGTGPN